MGRAFERTALGVALWILSGGVALAAAPTSSRAVKDSGGEHRIRLIRSWPEDVRVGAKQVAGRVEMWFDYTAGVVIQRILIDDPKGNPAAAKLVRSETFAPGINVPRPSPEEIAEAMGIVRADKEMARLIANAQAELDGGFEIFEPAGSPCGPGTRCLKVQIMTNNRLGLVRNVVVDLTKQSIVYREWQPEGPWGKK
jgi:hypothetical protein